MMKRHCFMVSPGNNSNLCAWWGHYTCQRSKCNCRFRWTLTKHEGKAVSSTAVFTSHVSIHSDITTHMPTHILTAGLSPALLFLAYLCPVLFYVFLHATILCFDLLLLFSLMCLQLTLKVSTHTSWSATRESRPLPSSSFPHFYCDLHI